MKNFNNILSIFSASDPDNQNQFASQIVCP